MNIANYVGSIASLGTTYFAICLLIGCGLAVIMLITTFIFCDISNSGKPWFVFIGVLSAYVVGAIIFGIINMPKWKEQYLATHTVCQAYGHKFEQAIPYHDVLEKKLKLANVITDTSYEANLEGNSKEEFSGIFFIYHSIKNETINGELRQKEEYKFYYMTEDDGYKKSSIPVASTTIYYIKEGESPYIEQYRRYTNWRKCRICGTWAYKSDEVFYKLYVPEGSIREEFDIQ